MKSVILLFVFISAVTVYASGPKGVITVKIDGVRSNEGVVRATLFKSEDGFPAYAEKAFLKRESIINNKKAEVIFRDVPYGEYAIGIHHDENANGKMETNLLGLPKEGQGASNNIKSLIGPPKFQDAKFIFNSGKLTVEIQMHY